MKRYTVSIQLIEDNRETNRRNFWVYSETPEEAVHWLDIQMKKQWADIRLGLISADHEPDNNHSE